MINQGENRCVSPILSSVCVTNFIIATYLFLILGAEHRGSIGNIKTILKNYKNVRLIQSRMAFKSFKIIKHKNKTTKLNV